MFDTITELGPYIAAGLSLTITPLVTFYIAKSNNNVELVLDERRSIREERTAFMNEIREELTKTKVDLALVQQQVAQLRDEKTQLEVKVALLEHENEELREELKRFLSDQDPPRRTHLSNP